MFGGVSACAKPKFTLKTLKNRKNYIELRGGFVFLLSGEGYFPPYRRGKNITGTKKYP